jgi:aerobic carbon-monoxide dehydrogenase medium subunit
LKPPPFAYTDPTSLPEALEILGQHGDDGKLLAGGQSLVPLLNMRLAQPEVLIDLNRIEALSYIRLESRNGIAGFAIGAMSRQNTVERSIEIRAGVPLLAEGLGWVGHPQIRNRGTVGGSIAHADPAAELPLLFQVLGGVATVQSTDGARTIAASDFFVYTFTPALEPHEMLTEVWFPERAPRTGHAFLEVARRHGDFALVAVAAIVKVGEDETIVEARIALGGAASVPMRATGAEQSLVGQRVGPASFRTAGDIASAESDPTGDIHADAVYRREAAGILTARALAKACERISQDAA